MTKPDFDFKEAVALLVALAALALMLYGALLGLKWIALKL